jgi:hypothetical protein
MRLGTISSNIESASRRDEFFAVARYIMLAKGSHASAARMAEEQRSPAVAQILKAAVTPGGFAGGTSWGAQLADFKLQVAAFAAGLQTVGLRALDRHHGRFAGR